MSLFIFVLSVPANAYSEDPCENIPGSWKGRGELSESPKCTWDTQVKFLKYADTIRMEYTYLNINKHCFHTTTFENFIKSGTCKNALINLPNGNGTIFGNSIVIEYLAGGYTAQSNLEKV